MCDAEVFDRRRFAECSVGSHDHEIRVPERDGGGKVDRVVSAKLSALGEVSSISHDLGGSLDDVDLVDHLEREVATDSPRLIAVRRVRGRGQAMAPTRASADQASVRGQATAQAKGAARRKVESARAMGTATRTTGDHFAEVRAIPAQVTGE